MSRSSWIKGAKTADQDQKRRSSSSVPRVKAWEVIGHVTIAWGVMPGNSAKFRYFMDGGRAVAGELVVV